MVRQKKMPQYESESEYDYTDSDTDSDVDELDSDEEFEMALPNLLQIIYDHHDDYHYPDPNHLMEKAIRKLASTHDLSTIIGSLLECEYGCAVTPDLLMLVNQVSKNKQTFRDYYQALLWAHDMDPHNAEDPMEEFLTRLNLDLGIDLYSRLLSKTYMMRHHLIMLHQWYQKKGTKKGYKTWKSFSKKSTRQIFDWIEQYDRLPTYARSHVISFIGST